MGARPQDGRVVPTPLLQAPARPQHRESQSAGGDLAHTRLLARAGVSGFRVDAVPFLFAKDAAPGTPGVFDPNQYLGDVRNFVTRRLGDAVLLGEVNLPSTS